MPNALASALRWTPVVLVAALPSFLISQHIDELSRPGPRCAIAVALALLIAGLVARDVRGSAPTLRFAATHFRAVTAFAASQILLALATTRLGSHPSLEGLRALVTIVGALALSFVDFFDPTRAVGAPITPGAAFAATLLVAAFWFTATAMAAAVLTAASRVAARVAPATVRRVRRR